MSMHHLYKGWNKTEKKCMVKFLTDPDSNLGFKDGRDVEIDRGTNVETMAGMEAQNYCVCTALTKLFVNASELQN